MILQDKNGKGGYTTEVKSPIEEKRERRNRNKKNWYLENLKKYQ
jgi:hypothetical protein